MNTLEVVRAGAGSGKTTDLCDTVALAVENGLDPARILATTFTRKAAAELKGRIQAKLLESSDGDAAIAHKRSDRLELAAIGTVHSVAHQLILRYAIPLGLSPRLKVLDETGSDRALEELLGTMPLNVWDDLLATTDRLSISDVHSRILNLLSAKRGNRISDDEFRAQLNLSADRVCELLAPNGPVQETNPPVRLYELVDEALQQIEKLTTDTTQDTQKARQQLRRMKAQRSPAWSNYVVAAKMKAGKRSGADLFLNDVRTFGARIRGEKLLHADIRDCAARIAQETIRLEDQYDAYKTERGLVDFNDLEVLLLKLLENSELADSVRADFDLILVDEFQDTNPLQLSIFQHLRNLAPRSRWVGDPKQAIYGFRDTDPQLVNDVWETAANASRAELPNNHRSQRGLVQLIGELFEPVLGQDALQVPQREAMKQGIERWFFDTKNQADDAIALGCGIAKLHSGGTRLGDVAVVERTNRQLKEIAGALDSLNIPYLLESPGLLVTREGALSLAGLRLVVDRRDSLAAATLHHILGDPETDTPDWIIERMTAIRTAESVTKGENSTTSPSIVPWDGDPLLAALEKIDYRSLPPSIAAQQVIEALNLPILVSQWGDAARRSSHLDSLLRHAHEYEARALEAGSGATLSGLILYLEALALHQADMRFPPLGHEAVTLTTYHSAKGLEWPVVILSGLDWERDPDMWFPVVRGGKAAEADPLAGRAARSWIWPFGQTDGPFPGPLAGSGLELDAIASPEGQEQATRDQEESIRLLYVGCTRAKSKLILASRRAKYRWLQRLPSVDTILDPALGEGEHQLNGIDTTYVVRHLTAAMLDDCRQPISDHEQWFLSAGAEAVASLIERYHFPSQTPSSSPPSSFKIEHLPGQPYFPSGAKEEDYAAIGDAVHCYFAALPSMRLLNGPQKDTIATRCIANFSVSGLVEPRALVIAGDRFQDWVDTKFPAAAWHTETNITAPRIAGGQWCGTADLLLQLPSGQVIVVDHKSAPIRPNHCAAKAATFSGQLVSYKEILQTAKMPVQSMWIHFPLAGVVAMLRQDSDKGASVASQ
jgi:superfamily I DNA/RNA helicase